MSIADALKDAGAKPAGKRPYFLEPQVEKVLAITMAVVQELAVARQRSDTLERLLLAKGVLAQGEIDAFAPDKGQAAERALWTQEYIARVLRIVQQENEAAALHGDVASGDVGDELAQDA
ncbi:MAG TPA: hypothetical protein VN222_17875 [Novosphingobium sp.]|nr:hypothetical protein [Novosphingobium sp.]